MEGFFPMPPTPPPLPVTCKLHTFLQRFWSFRTPTPQEIPISSVGELWAEGSKDGGGGRGGGTNTHHEDFFHQSHVT